MKALVIGDFYVNTVFPDAVAYFQINSGENMVWLPSTTDYYTEPSKEEIDQISSHEEKSATWVPTQTVNIWIDANCFDDANGSMGRGRLTRIKRQFRCFKFEDMSGDTKIVCDAIRSVGQLQDLYDWSSEDDGGFGRSSSCATMQIGYRNSSVGRNKGLIYRVKVDFDEIGGTDALNFPVLDFPVVP
ncbi:MAG: hypothetical protein PHY48_13085 [Candidatus Cloacimonetes bacterium]|nr:hypothetical protein [Candidatus Cloacimonadota bacterium]